MIPHSVRNQCVFVTVMRRDVIPCTRCTDRIIATFIIIIIIWLVYSKCLWTPKLLRQKLHSHSCAHMTSEQLQKATFDKMLHGSWNNMINFPWFLARSFVFFFLTSVGVVVVVSQTVSFTWIAWTHWRCFTLHHSWVTLPFRYVA